MWVWYPRLASASQKARENRETSGGGFGIHWPDIDEDLSTEGLLRGAPAPPLNGKPFGRRQKKLNEESFDARILGSEEFIKELRQIREFNAKFPRILTIREIVATICRHYDLKQLPRSLSPYLIFMLSTLNLPPLTESKPCSTVGLPDKGDRKAESYPPCRNMFLLLLFMLRVAVG